MSRMSLLPSVALLALGTLAAPAEAGSITGTITRLEQIIDTEGTTPSGKPFLLVTITGTVTVPLGACATSGRFVIDLSTTTGLEAARLVQLLYATGKTGRIGGFGNCDIYGGSETAAEVDGF